MGWTAARGLGLARGHQVAVGALSGLVGDVLYLALLDDDDEVFIVGEDGLEPLGSLSLTGGVSLIGMW